MAGKKQQMEQYLKKNHLHKLRIKTEDTVEVIAGNDNGARGRVLEVYPKKRRIVVESVNIRKKHQSAQQAGNTQAQGGIIQFEAPIHISNVMVVCPNCDEATRVGIRRTETGPVRVCKKCGGDID